MPKNCFETRVIADHDWEEEERARNGTQRPSVSGSEGWTQGTRRRREAALTPVMHTSESNGDILFEKKFEKRNSGGPKRGKSTCVSE